MMNSQEFPFKNKILFLCNITTYIKSLIFKIIVISQKLNNYLFCEKVSFGASKNRRCGGR